MKYRNIITSINVAIYISILVTMVIRSLSENERISTIIGMILSGIVAMFILIWMYNLHRENYNHIYAILYFDGLSEKRESWTLDLTIDIYLPVGTKVKWRGDHYKLYKIVSKPDEKGGIPIWYFQKYSSTT